MLKEDLLKVDNDDKLTVSFSDDIRLDEDALIELAHVRYVKNLIIDQNYKNENGQFYKPGLFRNIKLKKLCVHFLEIHSKNFQKTKNILHVLRHANITMLKILFEDTSEIYKQKQFVSMERTTINASHILLNIRKCDVAKVEWVLERSMETISSLWLLDVDKDVTHINYGKMTHIDNLHVCADNFRVELLKTLQITNFHVHVTSLSSMNVEAIECYINNQTYNLIAECENPKCFLVRIRGQSRVDLHITHDSYNTNKKLIKHPSIVQHKKLPKKWAKLYHGEE
jgi:hypothetical protein